MSTYGSTADQQLGIYNQPLVAKRAIELLRKRGYIVHSEEATLQEDMNDKIDYYFIFDELTPFLGKLILPVDVKYGSTYTVIDNNKNDSLEQSKAKYLIINNSKNPEELWWISVKMLKKCREKYEFELEDSYKPNNKSKFLRILDYVKEHSDFFGDSVKMYIIE